MKPYMKKRLLGYAGVLLSLLLLLALIQPGTAPDGPSHPSTGGPANTHPPQGNVRIHVCDEDLAEAFAVLAAEYTQITGVQVAISTAAPESGDSLPTLICLHSQADFDIWQDRLYDLSDSSLPDTLSAEGFLLEANGQKLAIAADVQAYGLICNARLLAHSGFTRSDIRDFTTLQTVSQHITGLEAGFSAFSSADLSDDALTALLSRLLPRQADLRSFWDLYIANTTGTIPAALEDFQTEKSVFYVGSTAEHDRIDTLVQQDLDILPLFTADGGSLRYQVDLAWGIPKQNPDADIQRTLEFLQWLATGQEGSPAPIDRLGLLSPFKAAVRYQNQLEKKLREYMQSDPVCLIWSDSHNLPDQTLQQLSQALTAYREAPGDESWQQVQALLPQ